MRVITEIRIRIIYESFSNQIDLNHESEWSKIDSNRHPCISSIPRTTSSFSWKKKLSGKLLPGMN